MSGRIATQAEVRAAMAFLQYLHPSGWSRSVNTSAIAADGWNKLSVVIGELAGVTDGQWQLQVTKTGTPGSIYATGTVEYRIVAS